MTVGVTCKVCGEEVVFLFGESETPPKETCKCGAVYELRVKRVDRVM